MWRMLVIFLPRGLAFALRKSHIFLGDFEISDRIWRKCRWEYFDHPKDEFCQFHRLYFAPQKVTRFCFDILR